MLDRAVHSLGEWLFGGSCFLCRGPARSGLLCVGCDADLPRLSGACCPRCALPAPSSMVCGRCLAKPPRFDATVAALAYAFPADALLHAFKFGGELALAPLLASLLAERVAATPPPDYLIPVPISAGRLRERGHNQALEIARRVSADTGIALAGQACTRSRETPPQTDLPWAERVTNVRGAFAAAGDWSGATIAVVDDVMTTGATLDEVAGALKRAGAARVINWIVARTLPPH